MNEKATLWIAALAGESRVRSVADRSGKGTVATPVYKKASVDLTRAEKFADFGDRGGGFVARFTR